VTRREPTTCNTQYLTHYCIYRIVNLVVTRLLRELAKSKLGTSENFSFLPKGLSWKTEDGNFHLKYTQAIDGEPVEGATIAVHIDPSGGIFAISGELLDIINVITGDPPLSGEAAIDLAVAEANITDVTNQTIPVRALVNDGNGKICDAWKSRVSYLEQQLGFSSTDSKTPQSSFIYASVTDGNLCALHPQVQTQALSIETYEILTCDLSTDEWCHYVPLFFVTNSTEPISTGDEEVDAAHNNVLATYSFFANQFKHYSFDGRGDSSIEVHVVKDAGYDNAYQINNVLVFGDGDGVNGGPRSLAVDVVAHEYTHGVTTKTSNLIYHGESGAVDEAMSDIFGSLVDRSLGASQRDVWLHGEDSKTPGIPNDASRYMCDPTLDQWSRDFYPERYLGELDNGGVHWNSGIANLAFCLLLNGGTHPRSATDINVTGLIDYFGNEDHAFFIAQHVFYCANVACLTPSATFSEARYCTAEVCGRFIIANELYNDQIQNSLRQAWSAVGVELEGDTRPLPFGAHCNNDPDTYVFMVHPGTGEVSPEIPCSLVGNYTYTCNWFLEGSVERVKSRCQVECLSACGATPQLSDIGEFPGTTPPDPSSSALKASWSILGMAVVVWTVLAS